MDNSILIYGASALIGLVFIFFIIKFAVHEIVEEQKKNNELLSELIKKMTK